MTRANAKQPPEVSERSISLLSLLMWMSIARLCLSFPESPALFRVCNVATFGVSEVGLTQLVVDGIKLLIAMEKQLEAGGDIDQLVPSQK